MKDYSHILRLVSIVVVGGALSWTVRGMLRPATFGQYGAYRGASVGEIMALPVTYRGGEVCEKCHEKQWKTWSKGSHKTVQCENCHGPGRDHALSDVDPRPKIYGTKEVMSRPNDLCLSCHARVPGRGKDFPQQDSLLEHLEEMDISRDDPDFDDSRYCVQCHEGHDPS